MSEASFHPIISSIQKIALYETKEVKSEFDKKERSSKLIRFLL